MGHACCEKYRSAEATSEADNVFYLALFVSSPLISVCMYYTP